MKTPGRTDVTVDAGDKSDDELVTDIIGFLGGSSNISTVGSCITRLRIEVKDGNKVDKEGLNGVGARGVVFIGDKGVQIIFGTRAQFIAQSMATTLGK